MKASTGSGARAPGRVRIPASQLAMRAPQLDSLMDPRVRSGSARIRRWGDLEIVRGEELMALATFVQAEGGGPLRTFAGNLAHENGWHPSAKARRLLHWEGEAQLQFLWRTDADFDVVGVKTENRRIEMPIAGAMRSYTVDVETTGPDGRVTCWEIKRDERALEDPDYRLVLASAHEILRRCGIGFEIVLKSEIFANETHRRNVEAVAARRFRTVEPDALTRLRRMRDGTATTLGELAAALDPRSRIQGRATVEALIARRRVRADLTGPLWSGTEVHVVNKEGGRHGKRKQA